MDSVQRKYLEEKLRRESGLIRDDQDNATPYIHDSGERQEFDTGAVRDPSKGKGRYDLISPHALFRLARHYEAGATKYADRNWEKGIPASRCFSSAVGHLNKWAMGKTEEDHLAAAAWNIFAIIHYQEVLPEMIDMGARFPAGLPGCECCGEIGVTFKVEQGAYPGQKRGQVNYYCSRCIEDSGRAQKEGK